jgi:hypothetical protein
MVASCDKIFAATLRRENLSADWLRGRTANPGEITFEFIDVQTAS